MPECVIRYARYAVTSTTSLDRHLQDMAREALAESLLEVLPDYIVTVLNDVAGMALTIDELEIDITPFHAAAYNPADLKIMITSGIQRIWENRLAIRTVLADRVLAWLEDYTQGTDHVLSAKLVSLEVNLYFTQMCGHVFNIQDGESIADWDDAL